MYIPISRRKEDIAIEPQKAYIPIAQRQPAMVQEPFNIATTPQESRLSITSPERPDTFAFSKTTPQTNDTGTIQSMIPSLTYQPIIRTTAQVLVSLHNNFNPNNPVDLGPDPFKDSPFKQKIFELVSGVKEIKDFGSGGGLELEKKVSDWKKELVDLSKEPTLTSLERTVVKGLSKINPTFITVAGISIDAGLNLTPFGGTEKNVLKVIAKTDNILDMRILFKKMGFEDDIAERFVVDAVNARTTKSAKPIWDSMVNLQKTTRSSVNVYKPIAGRVINTTDIQGNKVEQIFARKATAQEIKSPTAKSRGYNSIPDKEGYEKVFKPYGEQGSGYYYNKTVGSESIPEKVNDDIGRGLDPLTEEIKSLGPKGKLPSFESIKDREFGGTFLKDEGDFVTITINKKTGLPLGDEMIRTDDGVIISITKNEYGALRNSPDSLKKLLQDKIDEVSDSLKARRGPFETVDAVGNVVERDVSGELIKITNASGKVTYGSSDRPKTLFVSGQIRELSPTEKPIVEKIQSVIDGKRKEVSIAGVPGFVANDGRTRPLIFSKEIADKIKGDHGNIVPENLVINANDWDYVIRDVDKNPDKINLIKRVPDTENFLTIGANRNNGFFTVTHYETVTKDSKKLKNLLKNKGSSLDRTGRAVVPPFATSPEGVASQLDLSGVSKMSSDGTSLGPKDYQIAPSAQGSSKRVLGSGDNLTIAKNGKEVKQLPTPEGLPKIPSNALTKDGSPSLPQKQGQPAKTIEKSIESSVDTTPKVVKKSSAELSAEYARNKEKVDTAFEYVRNELELAEKGRRDFIDTPEGMKVIGVPSTFPKWIPDGLRSRRLIDEIYGGLDPNNLVIPKNKKQMRLFNIILDRVDDIAGINTRSIRRGLLDPEEIGLNKIAEKSEKSTIAAIKFSEKSPELAKATLELSEEATRGAKVGYKVGEKTARKDVGKALSASENIGKAKAENIAITKQAEAVRKEQLKSLRGGIKIRAEKDKIIQSLQNSSESTERIKTLIVEHVKKALDPSDRGKALVLIRDAKNRKDLIKAFTRVNRWAEEAIKKDIKNEILGMQKKIMDSPSIAIDYKVKVKELMGDFELKGHREDTLERLKRTQEFIQGELAKGNDVEIPSRVLKALDILNRTPFEEITISQLTGLRAEMELLENLGRTKFNTLENLWQMQKDRILSEISLQGSVPINKIGLIKPEIGEHLTFTQKFKNLMWKVSNQASRIDRAITPMDAIFDLLDGGRGAYNGANYRFFKGQVDAGYGKYLTRKDALQNPVIELSTKHGLDDTNFERIGVVAAREQDGGAEKLLKSGFTEEQINKIVLTKEETEVLDLMRTTFDSQFPEIQDTMRRVYNQPVEKVKNYFSFMTDFDAMSESEVFERFGSQLPDQYGMPKKNVEAGFTISRVGGEQKIKINALDIFLKHTDNTSYLLELGEKSKMLGEVASSPRYAELVGDTGQLMVREWLDVIARKGGASGASEIALLDTLRKNAGVGILGLKLSTIAIQPTALIDGMGFIGTRYGMKGAKDFMTSSEWRGFVAKMPELKDRLGGEFALRELTSDNWFQNIQRKGFIPMQKMDQMTAGMVAAGAYARKMDELGLAMDFVNVNKEALEYAQLAVRRTQSSGSFKDVPLAISRGALTGNRSLDRAMLQFQTFLLTRWSRIRHDAIRAGINTKNPKQAIAIMTTLIFAAIAASGIRLGVNKVQDFVTGREDEDTAMEDLTKGMVYEMTGNVPFLGTAISMAMYDGEMFPLLDAPKGVISGLNRVITSKSPSAKLRGFSEFAGSTGALFGVPGSAQAEQLMRGALQDEKAKPKTKKLKTPAGLPQLPSLKKGLPTPPGLPKLPKL